MCCSRNDRKEIKKELVIMCCSRNDQNSKESKERISHNACAVAETIERK